MLRLGLLGGASAAALVLGLGATTTAYAQGSSTVSEVVVTGSFIRGTPEDAALPVDVIGAEELQKQGAPSTLELIKSLSVSTGVLGDTNQFETRAQGSEGSGSINLRGLGAQRTLVLMNGRRITPNPFGQGGTGVVDTNIIPTAAIGRVEVLKDGAAATYGSDAIGGVVNFITRKNFEGLEVSGSYRFVDGSKDDYTAHVVWGWQGDHGDFLLTAGYQHRSELTVPDRDWANAPFSLNPQAGWSGASSVTVFRPVLPGNALGPAALDQACGALGGIPVATAACRFQFLQYDNLVEKENRYQIYAEANADLSEDVTFHAEFLYAKTDVPVFKSSPGYGGIQAPTPELTPGPAGGYFVPSNNPGYIAYQNLFPGALPANAVGAFFPLLSYRTFSFGGNPLFDGKGGGGNREYDAYRVSAELTGKFANGIGWNTAVTFSEEIGQRNTYDALVYRMQLAMRGYGSLKSDSGGCTAAETNNYTTGAGNAALGCYWFNPFSSSIPTNAISGQTNNVTITPSSPAILNSKDLVGWIYQPVYTKARQRLLVADAVLNGELGFFKLPGGTVQWALGGQFRREFYNVKQNEFGDNAVNPCVNTPFNGSKNCPSAAGPFHFLGALPTPDIHADVFAVFGELQVPITDTFNAQLAARYEDYGGAVGSTFNPKASVKWDVTENLALRGSVGSTFRGPPQTQLTSGFATSFEFVVDRYRAVDNFGNADLDPETAVTYNLGAIYRRGGLKASLDYWLFDFDNPIVNQNAPELFAAMFPGNTAVNCANPAYAALRQRFTFVDSDTNPANDCAPGNVSRIKVQAVNGAKVKTSGLDLLVDWAFEDVMGGRAAVGAAFTYIIEYKTGEQEAEGILVAPAFNGAGKLNSGTTAYSLPRLKGSAYAEYTYGDHNLRATVNYVDDYYDQRASVTGVGKTIKKFVTVDLDYRAFLPWDTTFVASVDNVFDEDPPFARLNLSYDPYVASGLGRTFKVSMTKKF